MTIEAIVTNYQSKLIALAYRMTGELAASQDMVQDILAEWATEPRVDVHNVPAYISKAVTNRCLNYLSAMKRQRELYKGTWLPEPIISDDIRRFETNVDISYGFMILLGKLTPTERAVFLLRESFDISYDELGVFLDLSTANCRQLYLRSKQRLTKKKKRFPMDWSHHEALLEAFRAATRTGDVDSLAKFLKKNITVYADGGGNVSAATNPVSGILFVTRYIEGLSKKGFLSRSFHPQIVNGNLGFLLYSDSSGQPESVVVLEMEDGLVNQIFVVLNPDKLLAFTTKCFFSSPKSIKH